MAKRTRISVGHPGCWARICNVPSVYSGGTLKGTVHHIYVYPASWLLDEVKADIAEMNKAFGEERYSLALVHTHTN